MDNKFKKGHYLGHRESEGVLDGTVEVSEKVDGANASVYVNDSGELICRSRNRELIDGLQNEKMFRLVCEYAQLIHTQTPFEPGYIYFGENMVKHTIDYGAVQQFIGYAVYDIGQEIYVDDWYEHFDERGIPRVKVLTLSNPTVEQLQQYLNHQSGWGTSNAIAEGIFLKNYEKQIFSKIVLDTFREESGWSPSDWGCKQKSSTADKIAEQFCTSARIRKGIYKLRGEYNIDVDMPMMKWLPLEVYEDMLQENIIGISKKYQDVNFGKLRSVVSSKCAHELKAVIMEQYK